PASRLASSSPTRSCWVCRTSWSSGAGSRMATSNCAIAGQAYGRMCRCPRSPRSSRPRSARDVGHAAWAEGSAPCCGRNAGRPTTVAGLVDIDISSDVVCPWCYIGKRRLETALADFDGDTRLTFKPFQLDPSMPHDARPLLDWLGPKFGGPER